MSRIIAQSFCWNCAQFIAAPLLRVHRVVDEIQCFDGAYKFMKDAGYTKVPYSTDGTAEVIKSLKLSCPVKWIPCTDFYENETAKKMFMQREHFWKPSEWKYVLSDDEIPTRKIVATFKRVRNAKKALVGYVPIVEVRTIPKIPNVTLKYLGCKPRFLKWQKGLHWRGKHYRLFNGAGQPRESWPKIMLPEMTIVHLKHLRPKGRLRMQLAYEKLDL